MDHVPRRHPPVLALATVRAVSADERSAGLGRAGGDRACRHSATNSQHAGKVIAWVGTAMLGAIALGGPIGSILYASFGFSAIALITALLPMMVMAYLVRVPALPPHAHGQHASFATIMKAVWLPDLGAALASIGYCAILAFGSLFFADMHWLPVWIAFNAFGVALIAARTIAGHLPDPFGGARVALIFVSFRRQACCSYGWRRPRCSHLREPPSRASDIHSCTQGWTSRRSAR